MARQDEPKKTVPRGERKHEEERTRTRQLAYGKKEKEKKKESAKKWEDAR